jgi:hypothetical protein
MKRINNNLIILPIEFIISTINLRISLYIRNQNNYLKIIYQK